MRKILVTAIGSLGDLRPVMANGRAPQRRGLRVVMAVPTASILPRQGEVAP